MKNIKIKMSQQDIKGFMQLQLKVLDYLRGQANAPAYVMSVMLEEYYNKLADTVPYLYNKKEATISIGVHIIPAFAIGIEKTFNALDGYTKAIAIEVSSAIDAAVVADRGCRMRAVEFRQAKQKLIG